MCSLRRPAHLLFLDHALADHLVDRRLDERARDRLPIAIALAIIWYPGAVGPNVAAELGHRLRAACAARGRYPRRRGPSRGPQPFATHGRRYRARGTTSAFPIPLPPQPRARDCHVT